MGLTGRTGSGCTTVANLLRKSFKDFGAPKPKEIHEGVTNDDRKYRIVYKYLSEFWDEKLDFVTVTASDVIFYYVLLTGCDQFIAFLKINPDGEEANKIKKVFKNENDSIDAADSLLSFKGLLRANVILGGEDSEEKEEMISKIKETYQFFTDRLARIRKEVIDVAIASTKERGGKWFQEWGNNIRRYNSPYPQASHDKESPSCLAQKIKYVIKLIQLYKREIEGGKDNKVDKKPTMVIIDSLRNPYEVLYFRERYSAFYLMAIATDETQRRENLSKRHLNDIEIQELDNTEYPEADRKELDQSLVEQDIQACVEMADIHLAHDNQPEGLNDALKRQLVHFIALMMHPGLVMPSPQERLMQIANVAKLNSGCLSRQVGAAICDANYSLKSIGWNTVPEGQTPCSLRELGNLMNRSDKSAYSEYELRDEDFREKVKYYYNTYTNLDAIKKLNGVPLSFCFKDYYIAQTEKKNQVHTRSLHAEENAFLQITKYGGQSIQGGYLFTTASPCELCAKKAYQLGIRTVYFIDVYPGISEKHILNSGKTENRPKLIKFTGAIGRAYERLYSPLLPLKDEYYHRTGVKIKPIPTVERKFHLKEGLLPKDFISQVIKAINENKLEGIYSQGDNIYLECDAINGKVHLKIKEVDNKEDKIQFVASSVEGEILSREDLSIAVGIAWTLIKNLKVI
ncbi:MAG: hypothetical protein LIP15_19510 [Clostridium sp.]|nr:hypothetical protein [Clostridium sp.]